MTRRRINLALVPSESARKVTFKKRKSGLVKKMEEITTLCGINGCILIYNPQDNEPLIWPSREKAMELMAKYESMPKIDQDTKKVDHEKFMSARVERLREHIAKREKKNKEAQASLILYQMSRGKKMEELSIAEVQLLFWFSDTKLKEIKRQNLLLPPIRLPNPVSATPPPQAQMPPPPPPSDLCPTPPPPALCPPPTPPTVCPPPPPPTLWPPPPPPTLCPPPFGMDPPPPPPPHVVDQGIFMDGNAQNEESLQMEPSYEVDNDPFLMAMFGFGDGGIGANGMWPGESSNGNQSNSLDFMNDYDSGFSSSFHGFF